MNSWRVSSLVGAAVTTALLVSGCGNGDSVSGQTSAPPAQTSAPSPTDDTADLTGTETFCQAARAWAESPAAAQAQTAAQSGDVDAIIEAYQNWAAPTQAMVEALPDDASAGVKKAYADLNVSVQAIAEEGGQTQKQAEAYGAAQGKVLEYFDTTCG